MTNSVAGNLPVRITLFCRVIDNFGDIGVCWRLARQFVAEHGAMVVLWVDDLVAFNRICETLDVASESQQCDGVIVRRWHDAAVQSFPADACGDVVIEGFGCALPSAWIEAMAEYNPQPLWINLEYLSAEAWVEDRHLMMSHYAALPLKKYFFFPGFSHKTGGLLMERDLRGQRDAFSGDLAARQAFFTALGLNVDEQRDPQGDQQLDPKSGMRSIVVSLFCYPHAPLLSALEAWTGYTRPVLCLVPEGVASNQLSQFFGGPVQAGSAITRGALTLAIIPMMDQPLYDRLLWACDLNFVRGEDSFVRAQWAARPFVWHIYPQAEEAHLVKLNAFFTCYAEPVPAPLRAQVDAIWQRWNADATTVMSAAEPRLWCDLLDSLPAWTPFAQKWERQLAANGDLAGNLMAFAQRIAAATTEANA